MTIEPAVILAITVLAAIGGRWLADAIERRRKRDRDGRGPGPGQGR
jgi:hypothetical protein